MSDLDEEIGNRLFNATPHGMVEQVSYMIFGAAATTTRAFKTCVVRIEPEVNRIFVAITLRWPFDSVRFVKLQDIWLKKAEKRCKEYCPENFRILVYYERELDK